MGGENGVENSQLATRAPPGGMPELPPLGSSIKDAERLASTGGSRQADARKSNASTLYRPVRLIGLKYSAKGPNNAPSDAGYHLRLGRSFYHHRFGEKLIVATPALLGQLACRDKG